MPELETVSPEDLGNTDLESVQYGIEVLEGKLAQMKPNMAAIAEYRKKVRWVYLSTGPQMVELVLMRSAIFNVYLNIAGGDVPKASGRVGSDHRAERRSAQTPRGPEKAAVG